MIRVLLSGADFGSPEPLVLDGKTAHYLTGVHRLESGARIIAFDGAGLEVEVLIERREQTWAARVVGPIRSGRTGAPLTLCFGLAKGEKLEQVVRQASELGVAAVYLLRTERSVVRLEGERATKRIQRLTKIAAEASRQCGRADTLAVFGPSSLDAVVREFETGTTSLVFHPHGGQELEGLSLTPPCVLFVGPEGGFSEQELAFLEGAGCLKVSLGSPVLRTETAATVGSALALHHLGYV